MEKPIFCIALEHRHACTLNIYHIRSYLCVYEWNRCCQRGQRNQVKARFKEQLYL